MTAVSSRDMLVRGPERHGVGALRLITRVPTGALLLLVCMLALWLAALSPSRAGAQDVRHVLVLHSYSRGVAWTDSEDEGIRSVLDPRVADIEVHTEYMDTKLVSDDEHDRLLFDLLKHKYGPVPLSVVIATDDDAYRFYLRQGEALFPGVPVVFCGVNFFDDSQRAGNESLITGVVEAFDIPSTLRTALELHPDTSRVIVINDTTTTGRANRQVITEEVIPQFADVTFEFFENLTMAELLARVRSLSPGDIILLMTFNEDRSGVVFSYERSIALIAAEAQVPIYGVWDFYLGEGIVGGMLASGVDQGRTAAEMALRIVDGEDPRNIPVITESPNRYKFDFRQMERFGIRASDLPAGSLVVGGPISFYAANTILVWAVGTGFLGLSVTIVLLLLYIKQRRYGEAALRQSEEQYHSLVDNINSGVCRTEPSGRYLQANPAMAKILGYDTPEQLMGTSVSDAYLSAHDRELLFEQLRLRGGVRNVEMALKKRDGTPIWASLSVSAQYDDEGAIRWVDTVVDDITESKKARDELQEAHDQLEARVRERTSELSSANEQLQERNLETAILYEVSSAISRLPSMTELLPEVLGIVSRIEAIKTDKGGIFVVEGDTMKMVASVGHSDSFVEMHRDMRVGDCLCGIVAQTGEVLISANSKDDGRHTIVDSSAMPHGHLIVPLKTGDRVEGVLDLYTPADVTVGDNEVKLLLSIGSQLGIAIANAKLYEQTKALALRDSLTGLWNHEEIIRILERALARAERDGSSVGVIMADLDHFKLINDTYGHMAGDDVLREVAGRMVALSRSYDAVGRYGGEEFMVVLHGCDAQCAATSSERLRTMIAGEGVETTAGIIPVTISLGVAVSGGQTRRDVRAQLQAADLALYRAKANGRNRVEFAPDTD